MLNSSKAIVVTALDIVAGLEISSRILIKIFNNNLKIS
jgi:hypothetical protein